MYEKPMDEKPSASSGLDRGGRKKLYIDIAPLMAAESSDVLGHPSEMPQNPFFEAVMELDKVTAVDCLRVNGRLDYLLDPSLWQKLAPEKAGSSQGSPLWFPGTKAQYCAYSRGLHGRRPRCPLVGALIDYMRQDPSEAEALVHHMDLAMEAQNRQHEATRMHIDEALEKRFGPAVEISDADTLCELRKKFQLKRTQLELERQAAESLWWHNKKAETSRLRREKIEAAAKKKPKRH